MNFRDTTKKNFDEAKHSCKETIEIRASWMRRRWHYKLDEIPRNILRCINKQSTVFVLHSAHDTERISRTCVCWRKIFLQSVRRPCAAPEFRKMRTRHTILINKAIARGNLMQFPSSITFRLGRLKHYPCARVVATSSTSTDRRCIAHLISWQFFLFFLALFSPKR